jgi:alpha-L-rhamnosidase
MRPFLFHQYFGLICGLLLTVFGPQDLLAAETGSASVEVDNLRCEYLKEPLGLDVASPRLSWNLQAVHADERGQRQTGYQILVASSEDGLRRDQADLWDSGTVNANESVNIAYAGRQLNSGEECYWKVRVKDELGYWSGWSRPAHWTMGLLQLSDWRAQWIGSPEAQGKLPAGKPVDNTQPDPWFRKTFELPKAPLHAVIYVASVGYHECYVNGRRLGDAVLVPATTDHSRRARYVTYDITRNLKPGINVIALWLGVSWSIFPAYQTGDKPAAPIVLAQADIELPGNGKVQVVTDASWKTHPSPNTLLGFWDAHGFGGEQYDANRELTNWCEAVLEDSNWKNAATFHPNLLLSADKTEPNRRFGEIKPVAVAETANGDYRVDMGVNYAGWFEMELIGQPGDRVEFQFSERTNAAMTFGLHSVYIIGPGGQGVFRNRFNYMSGRWVQISGLRTRPALDQMRGWVIHTDYQRASDFECDQPLLNKIYQTTLWTFENLSLGSYVVDCPQRERRGYGGDGSATIRTALDNYQLGAFCTKWMEDWRDVQRADGFLPHTAPTQLGGGGPAWSGFCVLLPWKMYCFYGDQKILRQSYPTIQNWLKYLETQSRQDMLVAYGGSWGFLGDWQWPKFSTDRRELERQHQSVSDTRESLFFNNCCWIYNLETAAKIADVIGENGTAVAYRKRADTIRAAVQAAFFHPADNSYVNGFPAYLAMALLVDLPPRSLRAAVWRRLEQEIMVNHKGHVWAGITGGGFLFNLLLEANRNDLLYAMISKEDYPGWGYMLRNGATTFYEDWDCQGSYLHNSYLYAGSWFIENLAGIREPDAGYGHFVIEPWIDQRQGPQHVRAHCDSLYGRISTNWKIENNTLLLDVTVPPNTDATVRLSGVINETLREGNRPLEEVKDVALVSGIENKRTVRLAAGHYEFTAQMNPAR